MLAKSEKSKGINMGLIPHLYKETFKKEFPKKNGKAGLKKALDELASNKWKLEERPKGAFWIVPKVASGDSDAIAQNIMKLLFRNENNTKGIQLGNLRRLYQDEYNQELPKTKKLSKFLDELANESAGFAIDRRNRTDCWVTRRK